MILRKVYTFIALFLLVLVVRADANLTVLAGKITNFAKDLEGEPSNTRTAKILKGKVGFLTSENVVQHTKAIRDILSILQGLQSKRADADLEELIRAVVAAQSQLTETPPSVTLQNTASSYFSTLYPGATIAFSTNPNAGVQLSSIITVNGVRYYTKTHRFGLSSGPHGSSAAKPVDPIELFVYKFLQYSGFGPEVHFFWASVKDFYIATRDIGYSKSGKIQVLSYETVKAGISSTDSEGPSSQVVKKGLFLFDIISRIFRLSDLLTNSGNYFFITNEAGQIVDFKIIDFAPTYEEDAPKEKGSGSCSTPVRMPKKDDDHGKSFVGYTPVKTGILKGISPEDAREIFIPMIGNIWRAIEYAFNDICLLQKQIPNIEIKQVETYKDLIKKQVLAFVEFGITPKMVNTIEINGRICRLRDVPLDGNCGAWAIMQALGLHPDANNEEKMIDLRQQASAKARKGGAAHGTIHRIQTLGAWLDTEDFQYFARVLRRPIAIVVQEGINQTYRHYAANGDITDPHDIVDGQAFLNLIAEDDTIVIYQSPRHYQTLLPQIIR